MNGFSTPSLASMLQDTCVQLSESKLIQVFMESWFSFGSQKSQRDIFHQGETKCNLPVEN